MIDGDKIFENYSEFLQCICEARKVKCTSDKCCDTYITEDMVWPNITMVKDISDERHFRSFSFGTIPHGNTILVLESKNLTFPEGVRIIPMDKWVNMWVDLNLVELDLSNENNIKEIDWNDDTAILACQELFSNVFFSGKNINIKSWVSDTSKERIALIGLYDNDGKLVSALVGFAGKSLYGIYFVSTQSHCQGKGYAFRLMQYVLATAKKKGYQFVVLSSTNSGYKLYKNIGFKESGNLFLYYKF